MLDAYIPEDARAPDAEDKLLARLTDPQHPIREDVMHSHGKPGAVPHAITPRAESPEPANRVRAVAIFVRLFTA
jgi:hypothetical protein